MSGEGGNGLEDKAYVIVGYPTGSPPNHYNESEAVTKFEIMDAERLNVQRSTSVLVREVLRRSNPCGKKRGNCVLSHYYIAVPKSHRRTYALYTC